MYLEGVYFLRTSPQVVILMSHMVPAHLFHAAVRLWEAPPPCQGVVPLLQVTQPLLLLRGRNRCVLLIISILERFL